MDRRNLLIAATAGLTIPSLLSVTAFAQDAKADDYMKGTLLVGTFSKKMSELAAQKAANARVKAFAGYEIAEQTAISQVLTNEQNPTPPALTDQQTAMLDKLSKESGVAFEKAYIKGQIEGHEKLLGLQKGFLDAHGMKSDQGHIAKLAETVIDMHLSMLHFLENSLG